MNLEARLAALRPRDRRALRLGAWGVGALVLVQWVVRPYIGAFAGGRAARGVEREQLAREYAAVLASQNDRATLRALSAQLLGAAPLLFDGADAVTASAALARYAAECAAANGLRVDQIESQAPADGRGVRVAFRGRGNVLAIHGFLLAMESGPKLVRVERLEAARADGDAFDGTLTFTATLVSRARSEVVAGVPSAASIDTLHMASAIRDPERVAPALSKDPFRRGGRLPNALAEAPPPERVLPVSVAAIRLLGTVIRPAGSFALCQLPTDLPRIVRVGEKLGEMTLVSVEQGRAVFQAPRGARLELTLSSPRS